jgi:hypothetical protein
MNPPQEAEPPRWSEAELDAERQRSLAAFIGSSGTVGRTYKERFDETMPIVQRLFDASDNLRSFGSEVFQRERILLDAARYLAGPPVSEDDLKTLVGGSTSPRQLKDDELARKVAEVLRAAWDPMRFPWLASNRRPTASERSTAILWTTGIWAVEQTRTKLRNESSTRQESRVIELLNDLPGFRLGSSRRVITNIDDLERGEFVRRVNLGGTRAPNADVAVRLYDGRLLALECKVSNTAVNSIKRLIRETSGKASTWNRSFGERLITGAVLAGVFKLGNLLEAQNANRVTIFWEHDLLPLRSFLQSAR